MVRFAPEINATKGRILLGLFACEELGPIGLSSANSMDSRQKREHSHI
jgi:hypothetical protein